MRVQFAHSLLSTNESNRFEIQKLRASPAFPCAASAMKGRGQIQRFPTHLATIYCSSTGQAVRAGKRGFIAADAPPILKRLSIDGEAWKVLMTRPRTPFGRSMGKVDAMRL